MFVPFVYAGGTVATAAVAAVSVVAVRRARGIAPEEEVSIVMIKVANQEFQDSIEGIFRHCDKNGDGQVPRKELRDAVIHHVGEGNVVGEVLGRDWYRCIEGVKACKDWFDKADANHFGRIQGLHNVLTLPEFKAYMKTVEDSSDKAAEDRARGKILYENSRIIQDVFYRTDQDNDGKISMNELGLAYAALAKEMRKKINARTIAHWAAKALRKYDLNGDQYLDIDEFFLLVLQGPFSSTFDSVFK